MSAEERRLWSEVAVTTRPLPGKSLPVESAVPSLPKAEALEPAKAADLPIQPRAGLTRRQTAFPGALPLVHAIERPVRRKLARGRTPLDARIDLHGLTEAVAHVALLGFLRRVHGDGARHVLVITGRGASFGSQGVLKRALPHWLATPEFRRLVAGFEAAARNHGGEGAVYLRLRRS